MEERTVNRRYRIDRRIGDGAAAVVYLGHDLLAGRSVAVKALRPQFINDRAAREQFGRNAAVAAGLTHPNIVQVLDFGEDAGTPYAVMEYLESEPLQDVIRNEGPFGPEDVAGLLVQVAAGLDFAHERGISHRCITPWNILVSRDGVVKLINVGHIEAVGGQPSRPLANVPVPEHFISPEQASGLPPTPSSDIYSLGIIAYEMLTGTLPFHAANPAGIAAAHVRLAPPPPSSRLPGIPLTVDMALFRVLEKDPSRRFATAGEFARAIAAWDPRRSPVANGPAPTIPGAEDGESDAGAESLPKRGLRARMSRLVGL